jgi:alpha,alpha-trehalase
MSKWILTYDSFEPEEEMQRETLCTVGNGYFAIRGAVSTAFAGEDGEYHYPATYVAGCYNRLVSDVDGRKIENEDLVRLADWTSLNIRINDGEWFRFAADRLLSYHVELNVHEAMLRREFRFKDDRGRITRWSERRFVSMDDRHIAGIAVDICPENWSGQLTVRSAIDGGVRNNGVARYRKLESRHLEVAALDEIDKETVLLHTRTTQSRIEIAQAIRTRVLSQQDRVQSRKLTEESRNRIGHDIGFKVQEGESVSIEKMLALYTSRDPAISETVLAAQERILRAYGFDELLGKHQRAWSEIWEDFDMEIETVNSDHTSRNVHVHLFHLLQTVSMHTAKADVGVPARGWHGEAYRGHIFWDEIFILPLLNVGLPLLTRALLMYRYRRVHAARRAARESGFDGAMYPWQSGSDGREESQRWHLNPVSGRWIPDNTHRQRHIGAAIAFCIWKYYEVSGDQTFLIDYGAEMFFEIARFWASIAEYNESLDRYEIKGVMGPDEFHTAYPDDDPEKEGGIDNNSYTNVMVSWLLCRALDVLALLPVVQRRRLCERLDLSEQDIAQWDEISRKLRLVIGADGIIAQFEGFNDLPELDWQSYRDRYGDIHRLDRILEEEGDSPNGYRVCKQPDVLMLFYLFSAVELEMIFDRLGYKFHPETIPDNVQYYTQRSTRGSTLSHVADAWVLARSDRAASWQLFQEALRADINDIQRGTTAEGIHLGAMAGSVDLLHRCYTGMETRGNVLHLNPMLPDELRRLSISIRYRGHQLTLDITHEVLKVSSQTQLAQPITIAYRGHYRDLASGQSFEIRLLNPAERAP